MGLGAWEVTIKTIWRFVSVAFPLRLQTRLIRIHHASKPPAMILGSQFDAGRLHARLAAIRRPYSKCELQALPSLSWPPPRKWKCGGVSPLNSNKIPGNKRTGHLHGDP